MSGSLNKVLLIGHLGADPEIKSTTGGVTIARLRIATSEVWNDKTSGQRQEKTEWHTVVAFDKLATICERYLNKGRLVFVEGALTTRTWDDRETGQKRYMTEIKARDIKMLGARGEGSGAAASAGQAEPPAGGGGPDEDDVPF